MSEQKKKAINKGKFVVIIIVFIALLAAAFFITKCACDNMHEQLDNINKWGINIQLQKDPDTIDYQVNHDEGDNYIDIRCYGKYSPPTPGKSYCIDFADLSGTNTVPLNLDSSGKITFPPESFLENHQFHCPLVFHIGNDKDGHANVIDGNDYIGKRVEMQAAIQQALDAQDIEYIAPRTNIKEDAKENTSQFYVTFPTNQAEMYEHLKNTYFELDFGFKISQVEERK